MDDARPDVDPVDGEPQRATSDPLPPGFLLAFVCDEVGADQDVLLTSERRRPQPAVGRRLGARNVGPPARQDRDMAVSPTAGEQKP
ncbi:hypothetical protein ACIA6T_03540 [Streptomyces sp. NPDC051740]|uniref:hypothetical protein n=1 Tax=Streptomyces sp. NPDC051740 TaxID=3365673 RepID=UPI0037B6CC5C